MMASSGERSAGSGAGTDETSTFWVIPVWGSGANSPTLTRRPGGKRESVEAMVFSDGEIPSVFSEGGG